MSQGARIFLIAVVMAAGSASVTAEEQATITSNELELQNNGELTIFTGNVILTQVPYEVRSDKMTRTKSTGMVRARGRVIGTWVSPKNERVRVEGEEAKYNSNAQTVEVWGKKQVSVDLQSEKGHGLFYGDRGWVFTQTPGKARLVGNVRGRVTPS